MHIYTIYYNPSLPYRTDRSAQYGKDVYIIGAYYMYTPMILVVVVERRHVHIYVAITFT